MTGGIVYLVGAGPGDPGLITVRGRTVLRAADVVVYDRLIGYPLLSYAKPGARLVDVGKVSGRSDHPQQAINALLVRYARQGRIVVRLKGGDPFVFGRGGEELLACREAGVPCVIIPGVTSATAGPAAVGIPITHRGLACSFTVVTAMVAEGSRTVADHDGDCNGLRDRAADEVHRDIGIDWSSFNGSDTLIILMGRSQLGPLARRLIEAGRSPNTPAACIHSATTRRQRTVLATLGTIAADADLAGLSAPVVTVIGDVVSFAAIPKNESSAMPLSGRRILITRERRQSRWLRHLLIKRGSIPIECPLIRIEYPRYRGGAEADIGRLTHYDWLVFTSVHGVIGFQNHLDGSGDDARALAGPRIAAIGPATARALRRFGVRPEFVPQVSTGQALARGLLLTIDGSKTRATTGPPSAAVGGDNGVPASLTFVAARRGLHPQDDLRVLHPCGDISRPELAQQLREAGLHVDEPVVYRTRPAEPPVYALAQLRDGVDVVLFHSPSAVRRFGELGLPLGGAVVACIGPTTAAAARELGIPPQVVAGDHTDSGLIRALETHFISVGTLP